MMGIIDDSIFLPHFLESSAVLIAWKDRQRNSEAPGTSCKLTQQLFIEKHFQGGA